ncbi:hypothetical protein ACHAPJ_010115 [Fusarium lateritium]
MASPNLYSSYKRDTKYLLYWMINVSNRLVKSSSEKEPQTSVTINTTGQTTVNGLISMSKLIVERGEPVPNVIYRLFGSIIQARSLVSSAFQQLMGSDSDHELKQSNRTHQHFIDTLGQAFRILGGDEWEQKRTTTTHDSDEDIEQVLFANKFQNLTVDQDEASSDEEEEDVPVSQVSSVARKVSQKPGKGRKGKKTKKTKKPKKAKKQDTASTRNDEIPIESIRIIEYGDELVTDYLIAVYSAVKEWVVLRGYIQSLWKEVAYEGLNSAVTAAVSNMAISMIKQTTASIFVDFPGHDSYETIVKTITRNDMERAQKSFVIALHAVVPNGGPMKKTKEKAVDIKEHFLIHAYQDLTDFILDFQANRSGKPTKAMQAKIAKWDPSFNLQKATEQERLNWRRCYTIKWLYDLVNVYSSVVVQRNTIKGENHVYERVNWSSNGPWGHRTIFGLSEFAGEITSMAMKKPGTDIRKMVYPHHVFQLQCIVDSFAVSRGWSLNPLFGHVLQAPATKFRPRRDVDLFLDRENKRVMAGYCQSVDILKQLFENDGKLSQNEDFFKLLKLIQQDFVDFLGEHKYMYGLTTIPPSRFSDHNANGLYEYSPFLCGAGLEEGLEIAYRLGMLLWERIPEPMLLIHLHHALVEKGYLARPIGLCQALEELFEESFFVDGRPPTSGFADALVAKVGQPGSRRSQAQRQALRYNNRSASIIHQMLDLKINRFFQKHSRLLIFRKANWNLEAISDEEIPFGSFLFFERLGRTKRDVYPDTNEPRLENSILVQRAKAAGFSEKYILHMADTALAVGQPKDRLSGRDLLGLARFDLVTDVSGTMPFSSINYVGVTCWLSLVFSMMEDRLKTARNPVYVQAYEEPGPWQKEKRVALTLLALTDENDECFRIMAEVLEQLRTGFLNHIYWEDLEREEGKMKAKSNNGVPEGVKECTVM